MPKYNYDEWEELQEEAFQESIKPKIKPKRKKKSYDELKKQKENKHFNKKHPNRD
tara:strand:+ start:1436 stop:1600 length:165 start_codon:yes stop_codon:yes gene_type:complete